MSGTGRTFNSVWVVCIPEYDNYDFDLYVSREAALAAIKTSVGDAVGDWAETYNGTQIEFEERTPVRGLPRGKRIWSLMEAEVLG